MNLSRIICIIAFIQINTTFYCQKTTNADSLIIQFANTYGQLRHFRPHQIKNSQWHNFLASTIQGINNQTRFQDLFQSTIQSTFPDVVLSQTAITPVPSRIENPVYWQHLGCGPATGNFYKSILVNQDTLAYLDNGFNFGSRIEKSYDSLKVEIESYEADGAYSNVQVSLLSYGWETGQQLIAHQKLTSPQISTGISSIPFNYEISNVFFSFYFVINGTVNINVKHFNIIGYRNGIQETIFQHEFDEKVVPSEISIGKHHSTEINQKSDGLQISCTDVERIKQLFPKQAVVSDIFESKLGRNLFLYVPLVIEKTELMRALPYADYSKDDFPTIAKCALIEAYCRTKYFNPNLKFVDFNIDSSLIQLYHQADYAKNIYDVGDLLNEFLVPLHDGHVTIYNSDFQTINKCLDFDVSFIEEKCYVVRSNNEHFAPGDIVLKINGQNPWDYLQEKMKREQGSYQKELKNAELYLMCGDSTQSFEIVYRHNIRKRTYIDLPKSESAIGIWAKNETPIQEVEKGMFVIDLYYAQESDVKKLISDQEVKGLILDARKGIRVGSEMLTYFTQDTLYYPVVKVPMFSFPDQKDVNYKDLNTGVYLTGSCNRNIPIVFITSPRNISSEETVTSMALQIPSCSTLGEYTGGCNGVSNTFYTIGGFEISFTGSIVNKLNGEQLYNIGYAPNIPVTNTKKAIRKNRDLMIIKAIRILK